MNDLRLIKSISKVKSESKSNSNPISNSISKLKPLFIGLLFLLLPISTFASEVVEFPEEELARESVVPLFDQPEAVKKRLVTTAKQIEVSAFLGASLNDPFFNSFPMGASAIYHLTEFHGFGVIAAFSANTETSYVPQIQSSVAGGNRIPFADAPAPKYYLLGQYEFTPYYGKVSFTKQTVMNLMLSFTGGAGTINLGSDSSVAFMFGMNQRLFLTKNFGLKVELQAMLYQQKDVVMISPVKKNVTNFFATLGAVYIIPHF